jgi:signal transduction histidine kinase
VCAEAKVTSGALDVAERPGGLRERLALLGERAGWAQRVGLGVAVAAAYVGSAKLGLSLSVEHGVITPVWAPTGIALAALVLFGRSLWPAVAVGALIASLTSGASPLEAASISVGNTLEAVVACELLRRVDFRPQLGRVRDVLALVGLAAVVSTMISATNGVTTLWLSGEVEAGAYASAWLLWWTGDAMGDLVVAPLILVLATTRLGELRRPYWRLEAGGLLALLAAVSALVSLGGYWRSPHVIFPLLVWATLRFRQPGAVVGCFVVAAFAVAGGLAGTSPITDASTTEVVQILEGRLAAVTISMLILGAVLTERASAEHRLERARAGLAEAQEVARIGSWEWNVAADRVTWSDELYRLHGLDPQSVELSYERFLACMHPHDRERVAVAVALALDEQGSFALDYRAVLPYGSSRWLHGRGRVDAEGVSPRMLGTCQDVTERHRLDELRDSILSTISHELRTPLTSILGFSVTLEERAAELPEDVRAQIYSHLSAESRRLDGLLSDLLDVDRLRHGSLRPSLRTVDVGRLVTDVVARLQSAPESDGRRIHIDAAPATAEVDPPKVERIVENLLVNAVKHTPPDASIDIRVELLDGNVLIAVDDRGSGIEADKRERIFELFDRGDADAQVAGTGIGLALVARFSELHGGRAWVEPNAYGGSSFRVQLPAGPPLAAENGGWR